MNELSIFFGPSLPIEFETVGLAFIAAPNLRSDSAIGVLSAARYAKQNYDHIESELSIFDSGFNNADLNVQFNVSKINAFSNPNSLGLVSVSDIVKLTSEQWGPKVLNNTLKIAGMQITEAGTWYPIVQPGLVWRNGYTISASGIEPSGSWLRIAIPEDGVDHNLILIYATPEILYSETQAGNYGLNFPPQPAKFKTMKERAVVVDPHKIGYNGSIDVLQKIVINDATVFNGTYTGVESDSYIRSLDKLLKHIDVKKGLAPDDVVEITYLSYSDFYIYSGFRDRYNNWWPFDANPEFGHIIGDDQEEVYSLSSEALLKQITLYAIPSAAIEYGFTPSASGNNVGTLWMKAYRAIDYGETHCIRHIISSEPVEALDSRDGGTVLNTWGYAILGRNFYDEQSRYGGDIFNTIVPSMIPLGRLVLGAPASVNSVTIADIRERGGGVPLDFPMVAVDSQEDGLDRLRGFFDLGIIEGKAIKEGGVVEVKLDLSILKTDPDSTDPDTFLAVEIDDIVKSLMPPGIDYIIQYVENL